MMAGAAQVLREGKLGRFRFVMNPHSLIRCRYLLMRSLGTPQSLNVSLRDYRTKKAIGLVRLIRKLSADRHPLFAAPTAFSPKRFGREQRVERLLGLPESFGSLLFTDFERCPEGAEQHCAGERLSGSHA